MELQQLRYVLAIAESGSFTKAARANFVVQSALSHQVSALEKELGVQLFVRNSRQVRLTDAGRAFLPHAQAALDSAQRARDEAAAAEGQVRGTLRLGTIPTLASLDLGLLFSQLKASFPLVEMEVRLGNSDLMMEDVRRGRLDAAFLGVLASITPPALRLVELSCEPLGVVLSKDHPLAGASTLSAHQLRQESFVDFPRGTSGRAQSDAAFSSAGIQRHVTYEVGHSDMSRQIVRAGLGVALLPLGFARKLEDLAVAELENSPLRREFLAVDKFQPSPVALAFETLVKAHLNLQ